VVFFQACEATMSEELLHIGKWTFRSRLILGTGRHRTNDDLVASLEASGAEVVTVAIRRLDLDNPGQRTILDFIDTSRYTVLPNTAGCRTADEALTVARLARSLGLPHWVKLEVIPDAKYLLPDPIGTVDAARALIEDGFTVLPYIHADPVLAKRLQEMGCATVMPLGSAIGSGQGIHTREEIEIIIEQASVPVVVDAGLGVPSDAAQAMEMGASAVLVNTAIAQARDPALMAEAFRQGVEAGRKAFLAGRIDRKVYAQASSPREGVVRSP
jgi:thiazole synthase